MKLLCILFCLTIASCTSTEKKKNIEDSDLFVEMGASSMSNGNFTEALEAYINAIEKNPENANAHLGAGMAYHFKERNEKAIKHLKKAVELNNKFSDARLSLGYVLMKMGDFEGANKEFDIVIDDLIYRSTYKAYKNKGEIFFIQKKYNDALVNLDKAIEQKSDFCEAHYFKGRVLMELKNYQKAEEAYKKAINGFCSSFAEAQYYLAMNYFKSNQKNKAEAKFKEIAERFPTSEYAKKAAEMIR